MGELNLPMHRTFNATSVASREVACKASSSFSLLSMTLTSVSLSAWNSSRTPLRRGNQHRFVQQLPYRWMRVNQREDACVGTGRSPTHTKCWGLLKFFPANSDHRFFKQVSPASWQRRYVGIVLVTQLRRRVTRVSEIRLPIAIHRKKGSVIVSMKIRPASVKT